MSFSTCHIKLMDIMYRISTVHSRSNSRSIQEVFQKSFTFLQGVPFFTELTMFWLKKYTIIGYHENAFNIFEYWKQCIPETLFGMKCTELLQPIDLFNRFNSRLASL